MDLELQEIGIYLDKRTREILVQERYRITEDITGGYNSMRQLFSLGQTVVTRGLHDKMQENILVEAGVRSALIKHISGDWGTLPEEDKELNNEAVKNGDDRILSAYNVEGNKIYIITEWDRSYTTIMLAEEY